LKQCYVFEEYSVKIPDGEYWTSGTDANCSNKFYWCSKDAEFAGTQITWQAGHPDEAAGDCVHIQTITGTVDASPFGTSNCSQKKEYFCEVRQKGTTGRALAVECMSLWDVTEGN